MKPSRRREILEAAERLFRHYGPGKTTVADIAREVGIGVGSVYLEFSSKDRIVAELSTARQSAILTCVRERSADGPLEHRLGQFFAARIHALYDLRDEGAHACDFLVCPTQGIQLADYLVAERKALAELFAEARGRGEVDVDDVEAAAQLIQRAFTSFAPPLLFEQPREIAVEQAMQLAHWLVRGMRIEQPPLTDA